jgi:hypothetical protein
MTTKPLELKRGAYGLVAAALTMVVAAASLWPGFAEAGQVTSRYIKMSDSAPSGGSITSGVGSGTNVSYEISFTAPTASNIAGLVVDICSNTPLIGDTTCDIPAGFNWGSATPTATISSGLTDANWTDSSFQGAGAAAATPQALKMTTTTPETPGAGGVITITVTGVQNPSATNTPFYARILTFDTTVNTDGYITSNDNVRPATVTGMVDYGGVALSTTTPISITARVMESLSLCTYNENPTLNCVVTTPPALPAIIIGHGVNNVLDATQVNENSVYSQLATNAQGGATIRMHNSGSACSGLSRDGGANCPIPPVGALGVITAGTAAFGMQVNDAGAAAPSATTASAATGGTGTATLDTDYGSVTANTYAMNDANVRSPYGDDIAVTSGPVNGVNIRYTFGATAENTTAAGIYTTYESLIGTGTF